MLGMHVPVCVFMCACVHVCMCIYVCMDMCVLACMHAVLVYACVCMCVCMYMCVCVHVVHVCLCVCAYMCVCLCAFMYMCVHVFLSRYRCRFIFIEKALETFVVEGGTAALISPIFVWQCFDLLAECNVVLYRQYSMSICSNQEEQVEICCNYDRA